MFKKSLKGTFTVETINQITSGQYGIFDQSFCALFRYNGTTR